MVDLAQFSEAEKTCPECGEQAEIAQRKHLGQHHLSCATGHEWTVSGCCPTASGVHVFRDAEGQWQGRYRDEKDNLKYKIMQDAESGEQAQQMFAEHLGVSVDSVEIRE